MTRARASRLRLNPDTTTVAVLEALRDVRHYWNIIRPPRWIGTEAAQLIDNILKDACGSWDAEINGYRFPTAATSVLQRVLKGTPRPTANRLATFATPDTLADRMRELAAVTAFDHVLEPSAARGRLIAKLPQQQQITAIEIDPTKTAHLAMMPHCREGAMSVSQSNFLDHVGKGLGYFGTFFNAILMTPPRHRNEDVRHVMAAWDCMAPGGTLVAVVSRGPSNILFADNCPLSLPWTDLGQLDRFYLERFSREVDSIDHRS